MPDKGHYWSTVAVPRTASMVISRLFWPIICPSSPLTLCLRLMDLCPRWGVEAKPMSPAFWAVALFLFLRTSGGPVGESWVLRSAYHGETAAYGSGGCERRSVVVRTWIVAVFFSLQRPPPLTSHKGLSYLCFVGLWENGWAGDRRNVCKTRPYTWSRNRE